MHANFASIMPQVIAHWCEEEGHDVNLVCYTGFENLAEELPDNVDLVFTPDSLEAIAEQALKRSTGARGLRAIMEEVLLNTMYDLPSRTDIEQVLIDRDVVEKKVNPTLVPLKKIEEPKERSA